MNTWDGHEQGICLHLNGFPPQIAYNTAFTVYTLKMAYQTLWQRPLNGIDRA